MATTLPLPFRHPAMWLATWFGAGLLPKAPGTWGSLAALPFAWIILRLWGNVGLAVAAVVVFLIGWWASARFVKASHIDDPSCVVIDEVVGIWLTLIFSPLDPWLFVAGFLLFRLFDIAKPGPVGWCDAHIKGGFGVMLDDVAAAVPALACLSVLQYFVGL